MKRLALLFLVPLTIHADPLQPLPLEGEWRFALDPGDAGIRQKPDNWKFPDTIQLPGTLTAQGFGDAPSFETQWTGETWRYPDMFVEWQKPDNFKFPFFLQPPLHYVGPAWYQRKITIPDEWNGHDVRLVLERPHWETTLWLDERKIGGRNSLGTPHRYDLGTLPPGEHTLTLRIDNRLDEVPVGTGAHSVSDQTQGNWNGVIGKLELQALAPNRVERVDVYPGIDGSLKLVIEGISTENSDLRVSCTPLGENTAEPFLTSLIDSHGPFVKTLEAKVPFTPVLWSEFSPVLYEISVFLGEGSLPFATTFGFREIENRDGILTLNGRRAYLRGTLECAIFPRLGHPPTDVEPWKRIIRICQAHGLNHIRFHSWCPPKAAFIAADELGFYYQVEASAWASTIGESGPFDKWLEVETNQMRAEYGNHPSFLLMAYGNEPRGEGHAEHLVDWAIRQAKTDDRRLYTTAAGWPVMKGSGYHNPFQPRIQRWGEGLESIINSKPPATDFDFADYVRKNNDAPVVSHEIGQWCAYPNFKEIDKYTGFFKARNFEIFQEVARRNGVLPQAGDFLMASGKWQAACYKHDIEAALRTPDFGGFQLLDLHDFPGQGTALVGVLDAFWDEKGYITAEEFHRFSSAVVPLARMKKMVFTTDETLEAGLELSHFGHDDLDQAVPAWTLSDGAKTIASGRLPARKLAAAGLHPLGDIRVPLNDVAAPAKLTLSLVIEDTGATNSWDLFVYPPKLPDSSGDFVRTTTLDQTLAALEKGRKVLWMVPPDRVADDPVHPIQIGFSTIFWNTAYTEWQPPHTLGLLVDSSHPALNDFPTDIHTNWQYWEIVTRARPFILTSHHDLIPVIQPIDDWFTNRKLGLVFEAKVGSGRLLACSADLHSDFDHRPAARQLAHSLQKYISSPAFNPSSELQSADLSALVTQTPKIIERGATIQASSQEDGFEAQKAMDGKPGTIWHSRFSGTPENPPHQLVISLPTPTKINALLITQRQDQSPNGRLSLVEVLDETGKLIATSMVAKHAQRFRVALPEGTTTSQFTIRMPEVANGTHAAIADIDIITSD